MFRHMVVARKYFPPVFQRAYCDAQKSLTEGEKKIISVLKSRFPSATDIAVQDISGGCGAMYEINIEAEEFKGKRTIMQHRLVNEALKEQIKDMHGLRINTRVPNT